MNGAPFTGLGVALATPFTTGTEVDAGSVTPVARPAANPAVKPARGELRARTPRPEVDHPAYRRLVAHVLEGGVDYLVVLGSTGEAATVTDEERDALVRLTVELAGAAPVVVGVGQSSTDRTCELARAAVEAGADGLLVVTPFYNKPQPAGLEAHYRAVAQEVPGTPIIAYNVPGRTGCNLTPTTLQRLWTVPGVVALKESSGDLRQIARMCQEAPPDKAVLAGDDDLALASIAVGARGLVSVCANVAPVPTKALVDAALAGDLAGAREVVARLAPLMAALFAETNPVPVKAALACLGLATGMVRAPLAPAEPGTWAQVQAALSGLGAGLGAGLGTGPGHGAGAGRTLVGVAR